MKVTKMIRGMLVLTMAASLMGCATIKHIGRVAIIEGHDALDAMDEHGAVTLPAFTNVVPVEVKPEVVTINEIKADPAVQYVRPVCVNDKAVEYGDEILSGLSNWHGMNIRAHANPGEFKQFGIPADGKWFPIRGDMMPEGTIRLEKTSSGCIFTAKDFTSPNGQRYRFEGWRCDGLGMGIQRVYSVMLTQAQMGGAAFAWYATVK